MRFSFHSYGVYLEEKCAYHKFVSFKQSSESFRESQGHL